MSNWNTKRRQKKNLEKKSPISFKCDGKHQPTDPGSSISSKQGKDSKQQDMSLSNCWRSLIKRKILKSGREELGTLQKGNNYHKYQKLYKWEGNGLTSVKS